MSTFLDAQGVYMHCPESYELWKKGMNDHTYARVSISLLNSAFRGEDDEFLF